MQLEGNDNVHYDYDEEGKVGFANKQDIKNSHRVQWRYDSFSV